MSWLAIKLPELPLQVFTRGLADEDRPLAVVGTSRRSGGRRDDGRRKRILAANAAARAQGVFTGQALSAAQAMSPTLQLQARQHAREAALLAEIACWAGRFTPRISLAPPDAVLLEIGASLRLFGGVGAIRRQAREGLLQLGVDARIACAPTPLAACWFAACGQEPAAGSDWRKALDGLPLSVLGSGTDSGAAAPRSAAACSADTLELLDGLGIRSIGAVRTLPAAGLARRQAQAVGQLIARARGELPDPRPWFEPPARFSHELALPAPTHHSEALLFAARRLFASLSAWLQARHAGIDHCRLSLVHEGSGETPLDIVLGHPSDDAEHLALIARERLGMQALPAEICILRLEAEHPLERGEYANDLFGAPGQARDTALRLLDRLRARLGDSAVRRLEPFADHRPEAASQPCNEQARGQAEPSFTRNLRPLWLLSAPRAIDPRQYTLLGNAERIESGWWDEGDIRRDYYLARRGDDSLCWVFQDLTSPDGWFLHGCFG
ncbi:Y-family DNA polymerase [Thauera sp.]|uniref:Y-family DNA polymerase n=1 Tax=Thauera sp. TaxID=1905334 RepID=UPI0039E2979C